MSPNTYLDNPVNGYACPTGTSLHYDAVPINGMVRPAEPGSADRVQNTRSRRFWRVLLLMCTLHCLS